MRDDTTDAVTQPVRRWYTQKRFILLLTAIVVCLLMEVGLCVIPMPLQVSKEICGLDSPLPPDGTPDYYAAIVQQSVFPNGLACRTRSVSSGDAVDNVMARDQNGFRDFLAALGPGCWSRIRSMRSKRVAGEYLGTNLRPIHARNRIATRIGDRRVNGSVLIPMSNRDYMRINRLNRHVCL